MQHAVPMYGRRVLHEVGDSHHHPIALIDDDGGAGDGSVRSYVNLCDVVQQRRRGEVIDRQREALHCTRAGALWGWRGSWLLAAAVRQREYSVPSRPLRNLQNTLC